MSNEDNRKQWNDAANIWVDFVRSGKNYYSEYLNGPALKRVIGKVKGKKVLDICCGEGYSSRMIARMGAEVTGIDISEGLIRAAREKDTKDALGITYFVADAANLNMLTSESFDAAFCYMAIMDIRDYEGAISEVSRVLKNEGRFVLLFEHPCFTIYRILDGKPLCGWATRLHEDGSKEYIYYWIADYLRTHSYACDWKHERLRSSFVTTGYHRPLSDYVNTLIKHRFVITRLEEPLPLEEGIKVHPPMNKHHRIPQSILIETTKDLR